MVDYIDYFWVGYLLELTNAHGLINFRTDTTKQKTFGERRWMEHWWSLDKASFSEAGEMLPSVLCVEENTGCDKAGVQTITCSRSLPKVMKITKKLPSFRTIKQILTVTKEKKPNVVKQWLSTWSDPACKGRGGWVNDKLQVHSVTNALAAADEWQ